MYFNLQTLYNPAKLLLYFSTNTIKIKQLGGRSVTKIMSKNLNNETYKVCYYEDELDLEDVVHKVQLEEQDEALNAVDLSAIVAKYRLWQNHMPRVEPHYAVKCNDDPVVLRILKKLGVGFDCASKVEIQQILDLKVSSERIIFANPCKPISHIKFARDNNITTATVDNEFEIYKIYKHYPELNLVMRIRCDASDAQCPLGDKYGCDADTDVTALMMLAKSLGLNVVGTSFHVGSGCRDLSAFERAIKCAHNVFNIGQLLGYDMKLLDIGGGFPGDNDEQFIKISESINNALKIYFPNNVRIIAEPGRFFVASAYTLICKVHARREVRTSTGQLDTIMYYVNDGVYGSFNCILYDHQEVIALPPKELSKAKTFKSLIWGPTCDALDKIVDNIYLPSLGNGDCIVFPNMGAYTVPTASAFNGFLIPQIQYFMSQSDKIALSL